MSRSNGFPRNERAAIVAALVQRDGPVCGICCETLVDDAPPDRADATTIDHIIALGDGGAYGSSSRIENLRLAHARCNQMHARFPSFGPRWFARELARATTPSD